MARKRAFGHRALAGRDPPAHGDAGLMHGLRIAGDERMPPIEVAALGHEPIGAGGRQPAPVAGVLGRDALAIVHAARAMGIVGAAAGLAIEEPAGDVGIIDAGGVFVLELDQTAARAAVAQALPFGAGHFREGFGEPEEGSQVASVKFRVDQVRLHRRPIQKLSAIHGD